MTRQLRDLASEWTETAGNLRATKSGEAQADAVLEIMASIYEQCSRALMRRVD